MLPSISSFICLSVCGHPQPQHDFWAALQFWAILFLPPPKKPFWLSACPSNKPFPLTTFSSLASLARSLLQFFFWYFRMFHAVYWALFQFWSRNSSSPQMLPSVPDCAPLLASTPSGGWQGYAKCGACMYIFWRWKNCTYKSKRVCTYCRQGLPS